MGNQEVSRAESLTSGRLNGGLLDVQSTKHRTSAYSRKRKNCNQIVRTECLDKIRQDAIRMMPYNFCVPKMCEFPCRHRIC